MSATLASAIGGVIVATFAGVALVILVVLCGLVHRLRPLPLLVFTITSIAGVAILLLYAFQLLRLRMQSPDITLRLVFAVAIILTGTATAFSGLMGYRGGRLGLWIVGATAVAPLMLSLVRYIED